MDYIFVLNLENLLKPNEISILEHKRKKRNDMWHGDQISADNVFCDIIPLLDNEIIIGLLPEDTTIQFRWDSSLEIIILQKVYELKTG
jgi:hypothetical protein